MNTAEIRLTPYIFFRGNCEEALNFYQEILHGSFEIVQRYDAPQMQASPELLNKVLHAVFHFGVNSFFASDVLSEQPNTNNNPVALSLSFPDPELGRMVFDKLRVGGTVFIPFDKQFWGSWHGNLTDKFGVRWMVNCEN